MIFIGLINAVDNNHDNEYFSVMDYSPLSDVKFFSFDDLCQHNIFSS